MNGQDMRDMRRRPLPLPIGGASAAVSLHPQTLRKYERAGLLRPGRRAGGSRRYSEADLQRLALIRHLAEARGINVAGMSFALGLQDEILELLQTMEQLDDHMAGRLARETMRVLLTRWFTPG
jgi:MerR family transcriptional regulator, heat shock protein HspR